MAVSGYALFLLVLPLLSTHTYARVGKSLMLMLMLTLNSDVLVVLLV
jgi:hypothetical protein